MGRFRSWWSAVGPSLFVAAVSCGGSTPSSDVDAGSDFEPASAGTGWETFADATGATSTGEADTTTTSGYEPPPTVHTTSSFEEGSSVDVSEGETSDALDGSCAPGTEVIPDVSADACVVVCEDTSITTLEEMEAFAALGCVVVRGRLSIDGADGAIPLQPPVTVDSDIDRLEGLETVRVVTSSLTIRHTAVTSLEGLESVRSVGGLALEGNPMLETLSGLDELESMGDVLSIRDNLRLRDVQALSRARLQDEGGGLEVVGNDALRTLDGLEGTATALELRILENPALEDIAAATLQTESRRIAIESNGVVDVDFPNLRSSFTLSFSANEALRSLRAPLLGGHVRTLAVSSNPLLDSLDFPSLEGALSLSISDNSALREIGGFDSLTTLGTLVVNDNPMLPRCGLAKLVEVAEGGCSACTGNDEQTPCD